MIVYQATKGRYAPNAEFNSWRESLDQMAKVLRDDEMPDDMGVAGDDHAIVFTATREEASSVYNSAVVQERRRRRHAARASSTAVLHV